ncbi:hypothetical protein ACP3TY_26325 [Pseudomonas rustica]|jgi:hypothetical protein|uniref:hypothetical protein n=1 Tax=Pseudomonas TaxID=286 RepID=UPI00382E6D9B
MREPSELATKRTFAYNFPTHSKKPSNRREGNLFNICEELDTETILANASENLLSIGADREPSF